MDRFKFRVWDKLDEEYYDENCFQMQIESSGDLFIIGVGNDGEDCFWETDNTVLATILGGDFKRTDFICENDSCLGVVLTLHQTHRSCSVPIFSW